MDKYNWDLTRIFNGDEEFNNAIKEANTKSSELLKYKGKILDNSKTLFDALELSTSLDLLLEKIYVYAFLNHYENMANVRYLDYKEKALNILNKVSSETSFFTPELLSKDYSYVESLIDSNLEPYRLYLERVFRVKSHVLSECEEKILSDMSDLERVSQSTYDALNNVDASFGKVRDENGNLIELNSSNYVVLISSRDRRVRKETFKKKFAFYKNHINTISSLYIGQVKTNSFVAKTRKYNSVLDMALFKDDVSEKLYETLIRITNKNTKYLKDYYEVKGKSLGYKLHMYDLYVNSSVMPDKKYKYEEAIELVNKALSPLGKDYLDKFNYLINNRCVDVYHKDKKRSGAYQWGVYGVLPYVSLNFEGTIDSVSTLAHEMGHAMHSYYSDTNQSFIYAGYPIFLAEIASTVNEILLSNYLFNNTNNKDEKIYYLEEFLDKFKATVYRQVMFADFEDRIHKRLEKGESLTTEVLCGEYLHLNKKHFSPSVIVDSDIKYEWARIPHFYTSFYVYKYATGFISALIIADKLMNEKDFKDKYIKFLSSGNTLFPLDLLKSIGIDLTDEVVLNKAFDLFNEKLCELKELQEGGK